MENTELPYDDDDIVKLTTNDDVLFEVPVKIVKQSETVRNLLADCSLEVAIPLPNVDSKTFTFVIEFLTHMAETPAVVSEDENPRRELTEWDIEWCGRREQSDLFALILAGNYLDIEDLLNVTCKAVANLIKGKSTEEIRRTFNITNDFTPEEEDQIRKENEWCEER